MSSLLPYLFKLLPYLLVNPTIKIILWGMRVVPSRISNLERKRGQYQDYGFVRQRNVAPKRRNLRNVWKEPCRGCGFVTFVTFLRFLGFAKKTKKIHTV